jgi:hypothetical protein
MFPRRRVGVHQGTKHLPEAVVWPDAHLAQSTPRHASHAHMHMYACSSSSTGADLVRSPLEAF